MRFLAPTSRSCDPVRLLILAAVVLASTLPLVACGEGAAEADLPIGELELPIYNGDFEWDHPAVGLLYQQDFNGDWYTCTATLIAPKLILTAAHCLASKTDAQRWPGKTIFIPGRGGPVPDQSTGIWLVDARIHPAWDAMIDSSTGDIALGVLELAVSDVAPIPLVTTVPPPGTPVLLMGFGDTSLDAYDGGIARRATVNQVVRYEQDMFVIDGVDQGLGTIQHGDSGGPGFVKVDGTLLVAGVNSRGPAEETEAYTWAKLTRVDMYRSWIAEQAAQISSTEPTVSITSPAQGGVVPPSFRVLFTGSGAGPQLTYVVSVDGTAIAHGEVPVAVDGTPLPMQEELDHVAAGRHQLIVAIRDGHGQSASSELTIDVSPDAIATDGAADDSAAGASSLTMVQDPHWKEGCSVGGSGASGRSPAACYPTLSLLALLLLRWRRKTRV